MTEQRLERIRQRAYEIWAREGRPEGRADEHWQQAETELAAELEAVAAVEGSVDADPDRAAVRLSTPPTTPKPARKRAASPRRRTTGSRAGS
jgi:Protein of unknown function (DUF2934)